MVSDHPGDGGVGPIAWTQTDNLLLLYHGTMLNAALVFVVVGWLVGHILSDSFRTAEYR